MNNMELSHREVYTPPQKQIPIDNDGVESFMSLKTLNV